MYEKVNPSHPDKIADRIAGAIVDLAYKEHENPHVAAEVLIGHGVCHVIIETDIKFDEEKIKDIIERIAGDVRADIKIYPQDKSLTQNQSGIIRCGDNGIFKGTPLTDEQKILSFIVKDLYSKYPTDGKYLLSINDGTLIACQSCVKSEELKNEILSAYSDKVIINPLGDWYGGTNVDTGATNRKLGSDMGDAVTGGGLHGKDLSKADVSVNIYAFLMAQKYKCNIELCCAIGDEKINGIPFSIIVKTAKSFINKLGGFEKLAEWGLI